MKEFSESRVMPYTAKQLYDLAIDIERYPEFVPLCKRASLSDPVPLPSGAMEYQSVLVFRYRKFGISEEFESTVTADPAHKTIISVSDGPPFTSFHAKWSFIDQGRGKAEARIDVAYEFRSKALALFIDRAAGVAIQKLISAWQDRALEIYGAPDGVAA